MTHKLQTLLGIDKDSTLFVFGIKKLEKTTGDYGVDTRLITDIIAKVHYVIKELRLTVGDTTGKELYYALTASVRSGDVQSLLMKTDYALVQMDDGLVSLNLIDVIECAHYELPYGQNIVRHGQQRLREEIIKRYILHPKTNDETTRQIIGSMGMLSNSNRCYNIHKHNKLITKEIS